MEPQKYIPSVGFFPNTFPRDPIQTNIYLEHNLMGQIIEPLVECDLEGKIFPCIASDWEISQDSKTISFLIRRNLFFSNGQPLTAEDVTATLLRHKNFQQSQSRTYLENIMTIKTNSPYHIIINLKKPYPAILKALSRDHLGIMPAHWEFNSEINEPFIGTGPYRAIRNGKQWLLVKNKFYKNISDVAIPEWELKFQDSDHTFPDFIPFITDFNLNKLLSTQNFKDEIEEKPVSHFFQSSLWWNPKGETFNDNQRKKLGMSAIQELTNLRIKKLNLIPATGIIPKGIVGYINDTPLLNNSISLPNIKERTFTLMVKNEEKEIFNNIEDIKFIESKYNIQIELKKIDNQSISDIVLLSFGGAFPDPEGFLGVIPVFLENDFMTIFKKNYSDYLSASTDNKSESRNLKYQALVINLMQDFIFVPGWKINAKSFCHPNILTNNKNLRYNTKLKHYKHKSQIRLE